MGYLNSFSFLSVSFLLIINKRFERLQLEYETQKELDGCSPPSAIRHKIFYFPAEYMTLSYTRSPLFKVLTCTQESPYI